MKKIALRAFGVILLIVFAYGIYFLSQALPIITGYGAKMLCSCTMVAGREGEEIMDNELGSGFLKWGSYQTNYQDSSATATVFGLFRKKAIYRRGLGCTLVNEISEEELRSQKWRVPRPKAVPDSVFWPIGDRMPDSLNRGGYDLSLLKETTEDAFAEPSEEGNRRTRAIVIVHKGQIIFEKYAEGFDQSTPMMGWSMTKSLTNAMVGILVRDGKLAKDQSELTESWGKDDRAKISIHHLMQMSSGLAWEEEYGGPSDATSMLFRKKDAGKYASEAPLKNTPGEVFYYSSGTTNILSWIIRKTVGDDQYHRYFYEEIFHRIGMNSLVIEPDPSGTFVGSSFSYATARDWARFGLLYLNEGNWQGEQILPKEWIEYTKTPARGAESGQYGAQFWLNAGRPDDSTYRDFPDVPSDLFYASGFETQDVFIVPSEELVVVKLSLTTGNEVDTNTFLKNIIKALPD